MKRTWNVVLDDEGESVAFTFRSNASEEGILRAATRAYRNRYGSQAVAKIAHLKGDDAWLTEEVE